MKNGSAFSIFILISLGLFIFIFLFSVFNPDDSNVIIDESKPVNNVVVDKDKPVSKIGDVQTSKTQKVSWYKNNTILMSGGFSLSTLLLIALLFFFKTKKNQPIDSYNSVPINSTIATSSTTQNPNLNTPLSNINKIDEFDITQVLNLMKKFTRSTEYIFSKLIKKYFLTKLKKLTEIKDENYKIDSHDLSWMYSKSNRTETNKLLKVIGFLKNYTRRVTILWDRAWSGFSRDEKKLLSLLEHNLLNNIKLDERFKDEFSGNHKLFLSEDLDKVTLNLSKEEQNFIHNYLFPQLKRIVNWCVNFNISNKKEVNILYELDQLIKEVQNMQEGRKHNLPPDFENIFNNKIDNLIKLQLSQQKISERIKQSFEIYYKYIELFEKSRFNDLENIKQFEEQEYIKWKGISKPNDKPVTETVQNNDLNPEVIDDSKDKESSLDNLGGNTDVTGPKEETIINIDDVNNENELPHNGAFGEWGRNAPKKLYLKVKSYYSDKKIDEAIINGAKDCLKAHGLDLNIIFEQLTYEDKSLFDSYVTNNILDNSSFVEILAPKYEYNDWIWTLHISGLPVIRGYGVAEGAVAPSGNPYFSHDMVITSNLGNDAIIKGYLLGFHEMFHLWDDPLLEDDHCINTDCMLGHGGPAILERQVILFKENLRLGKFPIPLCDDHKYLNDKIGINHLFL